MTSTNNAVLLADYRPPNYNVTKVDLIFDLDWEKTRVECIQHLVRHPNNAMGDTLYLDGEDLQLVSICVDDKPLTPPQYKSVEKGLEIYSLPRDFKLTIVTEINPRANKALSGLYQSGKILCTQNEAEGFRRITFFQDRPDVMAKYTTKIIGDKLTFPIMLSNGNKIDSGELSDGRHWALWEDPFNKPCYLYALVAGDLGVIRDSFKTFKGRNVALEIYCDHGSEKRCLHAMESLKKSMKWDEERFGLEYDLDLYMIVAVDSFNAGAMENKGLNIFNSSLTLADAETATDTDFLAIEGVIGHEYFHNWTGNRITCRDWFQLTLKEGLTVFRDQLFSEDMNSYTVQRLSQVNRLRSSQFPEDAGPMAHPIKPKSYISIDNFYSATVYEKGAEVIRMVHTLLGESGFRKGMNKYFELFDGQAVTTEDFLHAMSVANDNFDLDNFSKWYHQAGTPLVKASWIYSSNDQTLTLTLKQNTPSTPGQGQKTHLQMPIKLGLINPAGIDMPLILKNDSSQNQLDRGIILFDQEEAVFTFTHLPEAVVPSLNRDFSAPIKLQADYSDADLFFLMAHDANAFNRCEAALTLGAKVIHQLILSLQNGDKPEVPAAYLNAYGMILADTTLEYAVKASCLSMPMESMILDDQKTMDYPNTIAAFDLLLNAIARRFEEQLISLYHSLSFDRDYLLSPQAVGKRQLRDTLISIIRRLDHAKYDQLIFAQFKNANNMTDQMSALRALCHRDSAQRVEAIADFFKRYKDNSLVVQKWLSVQANSSLADTLKEVETLAKHPAFDRTIPNMVRALYSTFGRNSRFFHAEDGSGYCFLADKIIELDSLNPHVSAGMSQLFRSYKRLPVEQQKKMETQLRRILKVENLSKNTFEIVSKTLA